MAQQEHGRRSTEYGKRIADLTIPQVESNLSEVLAEAVPQDALENMPVGKIAEAVDASVQRAGFIDIGDILPTPKCKLVCKAQYPDFRVECTLECTFG